MQSTLEHCRGCFVDSSILDQFSSKLVLLRSAGHTEYTARNVLSKIKIDQAGTVLALV